MMTDRWVEGCHILCCLHGVEGKKIKKFLKWKNKQQTPAEDDPEQLGENPCGFCGRDGCFTNLLEKKSRNSISITVTSNCPYHYERMQYKQAATFSNNMPAQMCQSTVLSAPHLSQEIHKPFGNIMPCIILSLSIPMMA